MNNGCPLDCCRRCRCLCSTDRLPARLVAAKNIILAGVKSVTLHDQHAVELRDLGAQFYLTEADVGSNRAEACQAKLQELNTAVAVSTLGEELTAAQLSKFDVRAAALRASACTG